MSDILDQIFCVSFRANVSVEGETYTRLASVFWVG